MACARAQVQEKNECVASRMTFIGDGLAAPSCGYRTIRSAFHVRHASTSNMTCSVLLAAHPASASKVLQACSVLLAASNASHKPSPFKALTPAGHLAFSLASPQAQEQRAWLVVACACQPNASYSHV